MAGRSVSGDALLAIQRHFHGLILARADEFGLDVVGLPLPPLEPLLKTVPDERVWLPVPDMYGGFSYWLEGDGVDVTLVCESWSRIVGGSGQRHEITASGATLVAEGFV